LAKLQPPQSWQTTSDVHHFDAKLLLLSVSNADKQLKPGDATYMQRLEMMVLLAKELASQSTAGDNGDSENDNVAVAIIDEPTFVGKSHKLLDFLNGRMSSLVDASTSHTLTQAQPKLTFLMGFDTLERLFAPRYYENSEQDMLQALRTFFLPSPSPPTGAGEGDGSRVLCARRSVDAYPSSSTPESETLTLAREFIDSGTLALVDIGEDESRFSSSEVRRGVKADGGVDWQRLVTEETARYVERERLYVL
jgi:nicotinamide-nucleotide adenylyltransferase